MRKPPEPQDYPGKRAGGEHPDEAMSSKRWSTAFPHRSYAPRGNVPLALQRPVRELEH